MQMGAGFNTARVEKIEQNQEKEKDTKQINLLSFQKSDKNEFLVKKNPKI